jgi:TonB family protein
MASSYAPKRVSGKAIRGSFLVTYTVSSVPPPTPTPCPYTEASILGDIPDLEASKDPKSRIHGTAVIEVVVSDVGTATPQHVKRSSGDRTFDDLAMEEARATRFIPATLDCKPTNQVFDLTISR